MLPRHLPPTATPMPTRFFARSLLASSDAYDRLHQALREALRIEDCHFASTGRTALYLLLDALKEKANKERHEIVLPAYTCPSLVKVIFEADLHPRLVDISSKTMEMDQTQLSEAVDDQTLAIIVVHPFGIPHPVEPAMALADRHGAVVIEDMAQSMGAKIGAYSAGSIGHYGLFSLGPGKPLSAGGGGIICANELGDAEQLARTWQQLPEVNRYDDWLALARMAAFQTAFEPHGWWLAMKAGAQRVGEDEANWGFALSGLSNAQATIAAEQLPHLAAYNRQRQIHATVMTTAFVGLPGLSIPQATVEDEAIFLRLPLLFDKPLACAQIHQSMQAAGIGSGRMYNHTLASSFPTLAGNFSGAERVASGLLTLPTHHHVEPDDIERMIKIVREHLLRSN